MDHLQILMMVHSNLFKSHNDSSMTGYRSVQEAILEATENDNSVQDMSGFQCMTSVCLFT
jgi:hypothetical protein